MAKTKATKTGFKLWQAALGCGGALLLVGFLGFYFFFPSQSGMFSRWTGNAVELPMPKDCVRVINFGKTGDIKYLSYLNNKGEVILREYSDRGVLEATYKIDGGKFDAELKLFVAPEASTPGK